MIKNYCTAISCSFIYEKQISLVFDKQNKKFGRVTYREEVYPYQQNVVTT